MAWSIRWIVGDVLCDLLHIDSHIKAKPCAHFKYSEYIHVLFLFRRRFGDVFRLRFGHRPVVVLCGPQAVREALVEKADSFSERPDWTALVNAVRGGKGITFNIHDWQFTRRFAMTTLRDFGVGKSPIQQACIDEINIVIEEFNKQKGKPFNCQTLMPNAVSNIICGMVFNRRWGLSYDFFTCTVFFKSRGHLLVWLHPCVVLSYMVLLCQSFLNIFLNLIFFNEHEYSFQILHISTIPHGHRAGQLKPVLQTVKICMEVVYLGAIQVKKRDKTGVTLRQPD